MLVTEKSTNNKEVILASSSNTRIRYLKRHFANITVEKHLIDEDKFKKENKKPKSIVQEIAKQKAMSIKHIYPHSIIIGSDQILVCCNKIMSKAKNLTEAINNLIFLRNKNHRLISALYVIKNGKQFFKKVKEAEIFFKNIRTKVIQDYVHKSKETALSAVGSYKIEENDKYNFLEVKSGDMETIYGFPISDFLNKINKNG